jgi:metal-responsive CopG/Arc/MetJ family transcriptional regulator
VLISSSNCQTLSDSVLISSSNCQTLSDSVLISSSNCQTLADTVYMANSKAISIRIPDQLLGKIDQLAEEKHKSHKGAANRTLVILDIISNYFDTVSDTNNIDKAEGCLAMSDTVSTVEFNELRDIVDTLSSTVRHLEEQITNLSGSGEGEESSQSSQSEPVEPVENHSALSQNPTEADYFSWVRFHKFIEETAPDVKNRINGERAIETAARKGKGTWIFNSDKNRFTRIGQTLSKS